MKYIFILVFVVLSSWINSLFACSAFFWTQHGLTFGRNLDWYNGSGYLIKNNRGVKKYAYSISKSNPAAWSSKFGSFTFNQIGKEFPYGGINERGLVVEQLWLHAATYQDNKNEAISELEWIQYQLDNFENVNQVIENINTLTIKPIKATVHYFIADRTGNSAVIDFLGGKAIISRKQGMAQILTNSNYQASCSYYKKITKIDTASRLSEDRFCQVSENLKKYQANNYEEAFTVLSLSAEDEKNYKTFWSIVYDVSNLEIHFKTYNNPSIKHLKLNDFDFGINTPTLGCNLNVNELNLQPYTFETNKQLLTSSLKNMNIEADIELASKHQFNPSKIYIDSLYLKTYSTIKITFVLKNKKGNLYYTIAEGENNFNSRRGSVSNMIAIDTNIIYSEAYAVKNGEYGIASYHDMNGNKKLDGGLFGIPKEPYAFSNHKKGLFGLPPKYKRVKFLLDNDKNFTIKL
jgi:choloylglycine hydrolase